MKKKAWTFRAKTVGSKMSLSHYSLVFVFLIFFSSMVTCISQDCDTIVACETQKRTQKGDRVLNNTLKIAVLLPSQTMETDPHNLVYHNRLENVQMALETIADVNNTYQTQYNSPLNKVLPGWKIEVVTSDTQCSATVGPLEAFRWHCQAGPLSHTLSLFDFPGFPCF